MPKKAKELSALAVKNLTEPGLHSVGGVAGLQLKVVSENSRSWILRTVVGRKRRDIGLGGFPDVTLSQARDKARELKEQIKQGIDPVQQRQDAREMLKQSQANRVTFDQVADRFIKEKVKGDSKNPKHIKQWGSTIRRYVSPVIGSLPVSQIELLHIKQILSPIWNTKTETASRLRGRIESILAYATAHGYREGDNPARWRGNLEAILPKPGKLTKVKHHTALPFGQMAGFMADLRQRGGIADRALEFLILTAARSGEVRGALWSEIDLEAAVWTIPAERMKASKEHTVPLSKAAIRLLESLPLFQGSDYVFTAPRGGQLSDMSLSAVTRRMGVDAVPHGFRSTFRDWCSEQTDYPGEVCEMALAHTIKNKVEAAYRRGDLLKKRRALMEDWSECYTPLEIPH